MVRPHQPGEAAFRSILPEDIEWQPFPAFPPAARLAVLVGEPDKPGPYVVRVKVPAGVKPARQRDCLARRYTALPLGKIRRVRHASDGDWAARPRIHRRERRSATQERLEEARHAGRAGRRSGSWQRPDGRVDWPWQPRSAPRLRHTCFLAPMAARVIQKRSARDA